MDKDTDGSPVSRLDLILLIQAYNRRELTLDEFLRLSREWAEAMLRQQPARDLCKSPPESPR